jgi:hypothetical protein
MSIAPLAATTWTTSLDLYGLRSLANESREESTVGGISEEATNKHFAWCFPGSCARVQLSVLDPNAELNEVSDAFIRVFSGGSVLLVDLPCGGGAGALTVLSVLYQLRREMKVPRQPLTITIIGGEISPFARAYAEHTVNSLRLELESQAIWATFHVASWDVCDCLSNTDLIQRISASGINSTARLVLIANFSAFLQKDGKWKDAQPQFAELFRHCRHEQSSVIWIEPKVNYVTGPGQFFMRLADTISTKWKKFVRAAPADGDAVKCSEVSVVHPLNPNEAFVVHLSVKQLDLIK